MILFLLCTPDSNLGFIALEYWRFGSTPGYNLGSIVKVPDMEKVALLVDYVRRTMEMLDKTDAVTLLMKGQVSWLPLNETINQHI